MYKRQAQTRSGVVGVLATPGTLSSHRYASLMARFAADVHVYEDPCVDVYKRQAYTINIYCDLELTVDVVNKVIRIDPLAGCTPVEGDATLNATTGYGFYTSTARLTPAEDDGTNIDYRFQFQSKLQRPRGLRMMPRRIVDRIAQSISLGRVEEIADGFMESATEAFPDWLAKQKRSLTADWLAAQNGAAAPAETPKHG